MKFYYLFGSGVLALASFLQYSGAGAASVTERKNVPKSIRDNPGVYRSHYGWRPHYFGGK